MQIKQRTVHEFLQNSFDKMMVAVQHPRSREVRGPHPGSFALVSISALSYERSYAWYRTVAMLVANTTNINFILQFCQCDIVSNRYQA